MKQFIKSLAGKMGIEIRRLPPAISPGSPARPIGSTQSVLEDIAARGFLPKWILDVGANRGLWTRMALGVFPGARSTMIEPQEEMKASLDLVCEQFPGCSSVIAGAGRTEGELTLTSFGEDLSGSSFLPVSPENSGPRAQTRKIKVVTLDSLIAAEGRDAIPELAKLDIQGFELEALAGGSTLLGKTEVFILETALFEFTLGQPRLHEVIAYMRSRDYDTYDFGDYFRRPYDGALGALDIVFVHKSSPRWASSRWQ